MLKVVFVSVSFFCTVGQTTIDVKNDVWKLQYFLRISFFLSIIINNKCFENTY